MGDFFSRILLGSLLLLMWSTASVIHVSENVDESLNHISRNTFWKKHLNSWVFFKTIRHTKKQLNLNLKQHPPQKKKSPKIFWDHFFGGRDLPKHQTSLPFTPIQWRVIWKNGASDLPMGYFSETPAEATSTWRYETTSILPGVKISMKRGDIFPPGNFAGTVDGSEIPIPTTWDV